MSTSAVQSPTPVTKHPYFLRKWEVKVSPMDGSSPTLVVSSADEPRATQVTFDIYQPLYKAWWMGDVELYNIDGATTHEIFTQDMVVQVSAGYQSGSYGPIFKGKLFQPFWERQNVTDFKLTLHCVTGVKIKNGVTDFINVNQSAFATQAQIFQRIADKLITKNTSIVGQMSDAQMHRGSTYFGSAADHISQVAGSNEMQWWFDPEDSELNLFKPEDKPANPSFVCSPPPNLQMFRNMTTQPPQPTAGQQGVIIGTPQATQDGVQLRILLDSRVKVSNPPMWIKIDNSAIRNYKWQIGVLPGILDQDSIYAVAAVRHRGDSRGDAWYTEITGATNAAFALLAKAGPPK